MKKTKPNDLLVDVRLPVREEVVESLRDLGLSKGAAQAVVEAYPDGRGLALATQSALVDLGLSEAQARRVVAAFRVVNACDQSCKMRAADGQMQDPELAAAIFRRALGRREQEVFAVALLDARQKVIDVMGVAVGTLSNVQVHPRDVFREAIRRGTHSVIIAHNHPSGDAEPSRADVELTRRMMEAGRLVGIPVLDHLVVTPRDYASFAQLGMLPTESSRYNPSLKKKRLLR